jgi:hypothetical protein
MGRVLVTLIQYKAPARPPEAPPLFDDGQARLRGLLNEANRAALAACIS